MGIKINTPAPQTILTTRTRVKNDLGITAATYDEILDSFIRQASSAVETYCKRIFCRQVYTETMAGMGGPYMNLYHAPVLTLISSTFDGLTITDIELSDKEEGLLYREVGFLWTVQTYPGLLGSGRWLQRGSPIPLSEERLW